MTKHKKFIKSEKAKIKLNLKGAKLPKGLNVTKTEFKVKKIQIRTQLIDNYQPDGTVIRKQNVRELLSKLQHHNSTVRTEGLRYLKEQLATYPAEAGKQLGAIVLGLAQLSLDAERDVRKEGSRALGILLASSSADAVAPFFETLSSHLRCAMTHIQMPVQEDSLFMLDTLLMHVPQLVASNSDRIFSSFLDMISKLRIESKPERTLSVNLGSKITSVRWRSQVLDRLLGMLRAMCDAKRVAVPLAASTTTTTVDDSGFEADNTGAPAVTRTRFNHFRETPKAVHFSVTRSHINKNCPLPQLFRRSAGGTAAATQAAALSMAPNAPALSFDDEGRRIQHYAQLLMPLMFETWMEVRPTNFGQAYNEDLVLPNEAAHSLRTILEIIQRVYQLIGLWDAQMGNEDLAEWFAAEFGHDFSAQLFVAFPYVQNEGYKGSKRKAKGVPTDAEVQASGGSKCYAQNLSIAYLFACMNRTLVQAESEDAQRVVTYLTTVVPLLHGAPIDVATSLLQVLRTVLLQNGADWTRARVGTRKLLAIALDSYQRQRFAKEVRTKALVLLCDVVLNVQLCRMYGDDLFTAWLVTLPRMLCQPFVSQHVLTTFACLSRQKNRLFLKHLEEAVPDIIANLSTIQVTGCDDQAEGRRLIVNLFYWLDNTDRWHSQCTESLLAQDEPVRQYVQQIVHLRQTVV